MLDDLKYIHEKDAQDALGVAEKQWQQLQHDFGVENWKLKIENCNNIVVAGMGGSALAANLLESWPGLQVPYQIVRNYEAPAYVDKNTLFIASSYSGNTEETLAATQAAAKQGAQIVVIASAGKLAEMAHRHRHPVAKLPVGLQPRMAVFYNFAALVQILQAAGLIDQSCQKDLHAAAEYLRESTKKWRPDVQTSENQAKQIALEIVGKSAVVYAGPKLFPAAYKWKIDFNENAKNVAWCNQLPEFNHNEFMGWGSHPVDKPYSVIDLRSRFEHPRVQKRFEVTERLLSGKRPAPIVVEAQGSDILRQLLWTVALGDFASIYLAILNGLNPTPVDLIEKLKAALND